MPSNTHSSPLLPHKTPAIVKTPGNPTSSSIPKSTATRSTDQLIAQQAPLHTLYYTPPTKTPAHSTGLRTERHLTPVILLPGTQHGGPRGAKRKAKAENPTGPRKRKSILQPGDVYVLRANATYWAHGSFLPHCLSLSLSRL